MSQEKDGFLNRLFAESPYGIMVADEQARIVEINPAACAIFGYTREELKALRVHDLLAPHSVHMAEKHFSGMSPDPGFMVLDHKRKDGEIFPVELGVRRITYNGKPALLGMQRDISEARAKESELGRTRDLYQKVLDTSLDAVLLLDLDFKVLLANSRTAEFLRLPDVSPLLGADAKRFIAEEDWPRIDEQKTKVLETGAAHNLVFTGIRSDGERFPVEMNVSIFNGEDGRPSGFLVSSRDITERLKAENEVRESEKWLTAVLDRSPIYIFLSRRGRLEYVNKTALADAGVTDSGAMVGKSVLDFVAPEYRQVMGERVKSLMETGDPVPPLDIELTAPDGRRVPVSIYSAPFDYRGDRVIVTFALNTTNFREASQAARASQELYRTLTQAMPDFIYALAPDGRITYCNRWLEQFREDPTGKTQHEVFPKESADRHLEVIQDVLRTGEPSTRVEEVPYPDRKVFLENRLFPVKDESGRITGLIGISRDITGQKEAESQLRDSEERYRHIFSDAADPIFIHDTEGRILEVNQAVTDIYGFTREELRSMTVAQVDTPDDAREIPARMKVLVGTGSDRFSTTHRKKSGEVLSVDVKASLINWQGRPAIMSVCRDMTARKLSEEELRASEEKYRALVETTDLGYLILDKDGRVIDANEEYVRQSGHDRLEEILGRTVLEWTADFNKQANAEAVALCASQGHIRDLTVYYQDKKGKVTPIEVNATVVGEGEGRRILSLCRDITERVRAQEQMKRSEEKFSLVFREAPYGQIITRIPDGLILDVNGAICAMSGYAREEMIGRTTTELQLWESGSFREQLLRNISEKGRVKNLRFNFRTKPGKPLPADYSGTMISIGGENHIISTVIDLSEKQRAETALMEVQRLESLGMIAGGLAHDFNNMLAGIMGNLSLLEMDLIDSKKKELLDYVAEALEGVNSCRGLMHQFASFAKGTKPVRKRFNLCSAVAKSASLATTGSAATLNLKVPARLPDVDGDESQVFQTVNNIVLNAVQAMPSGGAITVELSEHAAREEGGLPLEPGRYVRIAISDDGIGMTRDILARIFDPYFSTKGKGRGLGLSMSFSVIRSHGGHIEASSEPGRGTRFDIYLPCLESYSPCAPEKFRKPKLHKGSGLILVLEDDESVTEMLTAMLKASGYTPVTAADGKTALRLFREKGGAGAFKAVLMDLVIPGGMGGQECLAELRKEDPGVAAVATSGYSDYPVMTGPEKYGFDSALPKPYSSEEFGSAITAALDKAAARARDGSRTRKRSKK